MPPLRILLLLLQSSLLFRSPALIIVAALPIDASLICLTTLNFRLATLLLKQSLLFLLLIPLLLPVTLTLRFNLSFRIGPAAILLLALRHFRAALFLLLPAEV